jgi:hypothetical protein
VKSKRKAKAEQQKRRSEEPKAARSSEKEPEVVRSSQTEAKRKRSRTSDRATKEGRNKKSKHARNRNTESDPKTISSRFVCKFRIQLGKGKSLIHCKYIYILQVFASIKVKVPIARFE